jgi:hypothetical protein
MKKEIYHDGNAARLLDNLQVALEKNPYLICAPRNPIPGLPYLTKLSKSRWCEDHWVTVYETPWGDAKRANAKTLGTYELYSSRFFKLLSPNGAPKARLPQMGYAEVDLITGLTTVYADYIDGDDPVYSTRIATDGKSGKEVLMSLRVDLAKSGIPVYPHKLYGSSSLPYPWEDESVFIRRRAYNDETAVPLVGYAVDPDTQEVVYLHIAGHKTALRSIWGTLNNRGKKTVTIAGDRQITGYSSGRGGYKTFSSVIDSDTNLYHLIITDERVLDQEVEQRAYLVIPKTNEGLDFNHVFAARLNALLPIPVLPEWGLALREYGRKEELYDVCVSGGDVEMAFVLTNKNHAEEEKNGWIDLIESLVRGGELTVPEL